MNMLQNRVTVRIWFCHIINYYKNYFKALEREAVVLIFGILGG